MKKFLVLLVIVMGCSVAFPQTKHECPECHGSGVEKCPNHCHNGAVYCTRCNYTGKISERCSTCGGRGTVTNQVKKKCSNCSGRGYFRVEQRRPCSCRGGKRPMKDRNGQTVYVNCERCGGTGYLPNGYTNEKCNQCGGSGYDGYESRNETCSSCGGNGRVSKECPTCGGKGAYMCQTCQGYANIKCRRCKGYGYIWTAD